MPACQALRPQFAPGPTGPGRQDRRDAGALRPATGLAPAQPQLAGVTVARARGCWVEDAAGRAFLDLTSGVATLNLGHGHPGVIAAARAQMEDLVHSGGAFAHAPAHELAACLARVAPPGLDAVLLATTGSEANELALRIARHATGRSGVVSFRGGFHGRTAGALACTTGRAAFRSGVLPGGVAVAPFPRPGAWGMGAERAAEVALAGLDELHRHELPPEETACYLVEPVQGQGGCHPAGRRFLEGLRERADRVGALLVFDEVQTGMGRTGEWFAAQAFGVTPDLMTLAKALGAGFPLSAVVGRPALVGGLPMALHGSTFGGSPLACAAAVAGMRAMRADDLLARARALAVRATDAVADLPLVCPQVAEVRGAGLMIGIELADTGTRAPRPDLAAAACVAAHDAGVLVLRSGPESEVIRILPPLTIAEAELDHGLEVLREAVLAACADAPASLAA